MDESDSVTTCVLISADQILFDQLVRGDLLLGRRNESFLILKRDSVMIEYLWIYDQRAVRTKMSVKNANYQVSSVGWQWVMRNS
jgi:hypothetical protein